MKRENWNSTIKIFYFQINFHFLQNIFTFINIHYVKCPYSGLIWSVFSHIRTEYGEILSPYSVRMWKIRNQITPNTDNFYAMIISSFSTFYFRMSTVTLQLHQKERTVFFSLSLVKIVCLMKYVQSLFFQSVLSDQPNVNYVLENFACVIGCMD